MEIHLQRPALFFVEVEWWSLVLWLVGQSVRAVIVMLDSFGSGGSSLVDSFGSGGGSSLVLGEEWFAAVRPWLQLVSHLVTWLELSRLQLKLKF